MYFIGTQLYFQLVACPVYSDTFRSAAKAETCTNRKRAVRVQVVRLRCHLEASIDAGSPSASEEWSYGLGDIVLGWQA